MDPGALIEEIRRSRDYEGQIAGVHVTEPRLPRHAELQTPLHPAVRSILDKLGIERLYSHQVQAVEVALAGGSVCVVASTAGGKTLCYTIPIAQRIYERGASRAFLVFPTKALAQDQLRKLEAFGAGTAFTAACYDGDTPPARRRAIRREAQVVLTNPDMLHVAVLPYHASWADFFRNLRFVVLDEVHTYRGVFGSHTANVIRRLRRIAAHYGASPQFICCSATIGNPEELVTRLTGAAVEVVKDDGAPQGRRWWVFWNPALLEKVPGRRSPIVESAQLLCRLVRAGVRTIDFTLARKTTELIVRHARAIGGHLTHSRGRHAGMGKVSPDCIMSYRGGYLPEDRRKIEKRLFDGDLVGVVSTSALELGIDIGHLRAVIMTGYPGTIASTLQQAGRAGRGREDALAVLIAQDNGIDQYLMAHPDFLFRTESERALIDPHNRFIVAGHLLCACYELELDRQELPPFGPQAEAILEVLAEARYVTKRARWYWIGEGYPAADISLRSTGGAPYDIILEGSGEKLGEVDAASAFLMVHQGAVYMHLGDTYLVTKLELPTEDRPGTAHVAKSDVDYYTDALVGSQVSVEGETDHGEIGEGVTKHFGELKVVQRVTGYVRRRPGAREPQDSEALDLPAQEYETTGLWLRWPVAVAGRLLEEGHDPTGSLHALEHALAALTPLVAPCDSRDVAGLASPAHPDTGGPAVFLYDAYPGGVGISEAAYERLGELLAAVQDRLTSCPCELGCPACVQSPFCGDLNRPLDKAGATALLAALVDPGR